MLDEFRILLPLETLLFAFQKMNVCRVLLPFETLLCALRTEIESVSGS